MSEFKLTTVEEFEAATERLLETGAKVGADAWQFRVKNQTPHCKFGEQGICCRICAMGPCRITPKAPRGVCGCDAHGIVGRNFLKFTAGGAATHSDHGREICHTLYCAKEGGNYQVKDPEKLLRIAKEWGVETEGKDIYDLAHECEKTGAPIVRPLVYEYPADKHVRNISDEYMLGSFVLVAPVIAPGKEAREVYLPDGDWYDYYTGEKYNGGRYILADAPLDKVPVFIKAGAIIPVADGEIRSTEDITEDKISILTYPGKGSFVHYQDDNETFAYRNGAYNAVEYTLDGDKLEKKVLHKGL